MDMNNLENIGIKQDIVILSAKQWSLVTEDTKETRKGTTVWYTYDKPQHMNEDGSCGDDPVKATLEYDYIDQIRYRGGAPVKATALFVMRVRKNTPTLVIDQILFDQKPAEPETAPAKEAKK